MVGRCELHLTWEIRGFHGSDDDDDDDDAVLLGFGAV
jgi:hypothetical protein